ncbi:MAG: hypothetical protein ABI855_01040 [Bacteroidota bacterium]
MAFKIIKRRYAFSDVTLGELGDSLVGFAERDILQMNPFGYDQPRLDGIKDQIKLFKEFPSDEYFAGRLMGAAADKNTAIQVMSAMAEGVVRRAITKWGKDSYRIRAFGWTGYITKPDAEKTATCRLVHKMGTMVQPDLASLGLDAALLDDLKIKITEADDAMVMKLVRVSERDGKVNERIAAANELYVELVKLADTGKHIFKEINESYYNDYVIYEPAPDLQTVTGTVGKSVIHQPSVEINSKNDEIKISVGDPRASLFVYMADDPTSEPAEGQTVVEVTAGPRVTLKAEDLKWSKKNNRLLLKNASTAIEADFILTVKG